jgi:hypothetical protein
MRLPAIGAAIMLVSAFAAPAMAQQLPAMDFTGSWLFTWQNDAKNSNRAIMKHEAGTITGSYINDSKEKCPLVGRLVSSETGVLLTIMCPGWDIRADGSIKDAQLVDGRYVAYGSSTGEFRLTRQSR